jgi:YidC/Oxa1 family membrane protein insertase
MSLSFLFDELLYRPILNFLVLLQNIIPGHDFGLAIIILTALIRLILWPLAGQSIRSQKALQELQPEISKLKEKYKNDKQKQMQATMELYKSKNINPASGCLPLLIQLPVLIALYYALWNGLKSTIGESLYSFVHLSDGVNFLFLGLINLAEPSIPLGVLAGILQYYQTKMMMVKNTSSQPEKSGKERSFSDDFAKTMNTQMLYIMPLLTVFIASTFPSGLALYWVTTSVISIVQQHYQMKNKSF